MIFKTTVLLISLIWCAQSHTDTKDNPVGVIDLLNIVIDGHHGVMDTNTLQLVGKAENLTFKNCNFTVFNENFLNPIKNVRSLIFANNKFGKVIVDNTTEPCCEQLSEMLLIDSSVGNYSEEEFKMTAYLKALERLQCIKMEVPVLYANALAGSNLKIFEVVDSGLIEMQDGALNGMSKLEILDLHVNKLKSVPTASLAAVKTLKELNLKSNLIEKITAADIPSLPNLEKLNLAHNPIKEINLTGLKEKLPKIKEIDCSGINIDLSKAEGLPIVKKEIH